MGQTRHFTLTLSGSAQALSAGQTQQGLVKQLILHADPANGNVIYVGSATDTLSSANYGFRIEAPVSTIPAAPTVIEAVNTNLADIRVLGTNTEKLHVLVITS